MTARTAEPLQRILEAGRPAMAAEIDDARPVRSFVALLAKHDWAYRVSYSRSLVEVGEKLSAHAYLGVRGQYEARQVSTSWDVNLDVEPVKWTRGTSWIWGSAAAEPIYLTRVGAMEMRAWITDEEKWLTTYLPLHDQEDGWTW